MNVLLSRKLFKSLKSGKKIRIKVGKVTPAVEKIILDIAEVIFKQYKTEFAAYPIMTCVMELLNNALKANYKRIYFENLNPSTIADDLDYDLTLKLFKHELNRRDENVLIKMAMEKNIKAEVVFQLLDNILKVNVINPGSIIAEEYHEILQKIDDCRDSQTLSDYFLTNSNKGRNEGAGLGLVLLMMVLRGLGIEDNFSINSNSEYTNATIIIPIDDKLEYNFKKNTSHNHSENK